MADEDPFSAFASPANADGGFEQADAGFDFAGEAAAAPLDGGFDFAAAAGDQPAADQGFDFGGAAAEQPALEQQDSFGGFEQAADQPLDMDMGGFAQPEQQSEAPLDMGGFAQPEQQSEAPLDMGGFAQPEPAADVGGFAQPEPAQDFAAPVEVQDTALSKWRVERENVLRERATKAQNDKAASMSAAAEEMSSFFAEREKRIATRKNLNRDEEAATQNNKVNFNGTIWQKVNTLVDLQVKVVGKGVPATQTDRMRKLLIQLKNEPADKENAAIFS